MPPGSTHARWAASPFIALLIHTGASVRMGDFSDRTRAVTHLDVSHGDIEQALTVLDGIVRRNRA